MRYHIRLFFNEQQYLHTATKVHVGLSRLAAQGTLTLRLVTCHEPYVLNNVTVLLEAERTADGRHLRIACDLRDRADALTPEALSWSDVYFKRSYDARELGAATTGARAKILPFGLNYACTDSASKGRILRLLTLRLLHLLLTHPLQARQQLAWFRRNFSDYVPIADFAEFEQDAAALEPLVVYQPRLYPPEGTLENWQELNDSRATVVRALRTALGAQFIGGIEPTEFTRATYPEDLTLQPTRHRGYIDMARRAAIGVSTRGLHHSLPFKLPEYLASSKCIVSEPLRHQLPVPLEPEQNYLEFTTPEACVEQCRRLLADPELAAAMRLRNAVYYRQEVEPAAHLLNCLDRAFSAATP